MPVQNYTRQMINKPVNGTLFPWNKSMEEISMELWKPVDNSMGFHASVTCLFHGSRGDNQEKKIEVLGVG
jgi:hypothetical protein